MSFERARKCVQCARTSNSKAVVHIVEMEGNLSTGSWSEKVLEEVLAGAPALDKPMACPTTPAAFKGGAAARAMPPTPTLPQGGWLGASRLRIVFLTHAPFCTFARGHRPVLRISDEVRLWIMPCFLSSWRKYSCHYKVEYAYLLVRYREVTKIKVYFLFCPFKIFFIFWNLSNFHDQNPPKNSQGSCKTLLVLTDEFFVCSFIYIHFRPCSHSFQGLVNHELKLSCTEKVHRALSLHVTIMKISWIWHERKGAVNFFGYSSWMWKLYFSLV